VIFKLRSLIPGRWLNMRLLHCESVIHYVDLLEAQLPVNHLNLINHELGLRYRTPCQTSSGRSRNAAERTAALVMTVNALSRPVLGDSSRSRAGCGRLSRSLMSGRGALTTALPFFLKAMPAT